MSEGQFVSAKQVSSTPQIASIYLKTRQKDYKKFCSEFTMEVMHGNLFHTFENKHEAVINTNGSITFIYPDKDKIDFFNTFEQFAAFYLAKFW